MRARIKIYWPMNALARGAKGRHISVPSSENPSMTLNPHPLARVFCLLGLPAFAVNAELLQPGVDIDETRTPIQWI